METWKPILGYEGIYEISNTGKVKALAVKKYRGRFLQDRGEYLLSQKINRGGYVEVTICKDGTMKSITVHRLVALHFVNNEFNKPMINHLDGIKTNNSYTNLEWCTNDENMKHAVETGLINNKGENAHHSKLKNEQVLFMRASNLDNKELAEMFSVHPYTVKRIREGKLWVNLL